MTCRPYDPLIASGSFALTAILLSACSLLGGEGPTPGDPSDYGLQAIDLEEYWEEAELQASDWYSDAHVSQVSIDVEMPNSPGSSSAIQFKMESPTNDMVSLSVSCEDGNCRAIEFEQSPGLPIQYCRPIELADPEITSQRALRIGLENGGSNYIYNTEATALLILSYASGNKVCSDRLTWTATFFEPVTRGVRVIIDATTGEILE